ncbi:MAG TPA: hypothetical protein VFQ45_20055 [Longimicrobium sp.]|nr:hypothetical protein [Longimicrobium sp.]
MDLSDKLSITISLLALFTAGGSWWKSHRLELARDAERKEEARTANVTAFRRGLHQLVVYNAGPALARDIRVFYEGKEIERHPAVLNRAGPIPALLPGTEHVYHVLGEQMFSPVLAGMIRVEWSHDARPPGRCEATLGQEG